jgi:hypothetical protein
MRMLHNHTALRGQHKPASNFLELRDKTRCNALIFTSSLLPESEEMVRNIKRVAFEIQNSEYEEWKENLVDITENFKLKGKKCKYLLMLHESLMVELKKNEDDAVVRTFEMEDLNEIYEKEKQKLLKEASSYEKDKEFLDKLATVLMIPTLGIATLICRSKSKKAKRKSEKKLLEASVSGKNEDITHEAVNLTKEVLIPAITNFLTGLNACNKFLIVSNDQLSEMGKEDEYEPSRYFRLMKGHAKELNSNCNFFLTTSSQIRTDMRTIPTQSTDKIYVDNWLKTQLAALNEAKPVHNILNTL